MDNFVPQSTAQVRAGHDESDLSIRGIITFGIILAVSGLLSFVAMRIFLGWLPSIEAYLFPARPLTPAQEQLRQARVPAPSEPTRLTEAPGQRAEEEERLQRTFPTPRLQYDDTREMAAFRGSEDKWLESTGKDANGNIHVSIEDAKKLVVQQGLPAVSGPFVPPTLPSAVPLVPAPAPQRK